MIIRQLSKTGPLIADDSIFQDHQAKHDGSNASGDNIDRVYHRR